MKNRIKEVMSQMGRQQSELARQMGMSKIGINQLINSNMPKLDTFQRFADALGVPVWQLLLTDDEMRDIARHIADDGGTVVVSQYLQCPRCGQLFNVTPCKILQ